MHSTKTEILFILKRRDGATVDDIASSLSLAPMTVRQHLNTLQRDALIRADEVRRSTGRPHYRYSLSDEGHRSIAQGHDRLLVLLLDAVGSLGPEDVAGATPDQRRARVFHAAAYALADRYRGEVLGLPTASRIPRVVEILRAHGGFADWHQNGEGGELRDFSCVYRAVVDDGGPCQWHEPLLEALLGAIEPVAASDDCVACCRYTITIPAGRPAATSSALTGAARTGI